MLASEAQHSWAERERQTDLTGDGWPDIAVRNADDKRMYILPTAGQQDYLPPVAVASGWQSRDLIATPGDVTGDKIPDVLARDADSRVTDVFPGTAAGGLGDPVKQLGRFKGVDLMFGIGDWNHDGYPTSSAARPGRQAGAVPRPPQRPLRHAVGADERRFGISRRSSGSGDFDDNHSLDLVMQTPDGALWELPRHGKESG